MQKCNLTFGIPAYNAERFLADLLKQFTLTEFITYEVIVVNDGSVDGTLHICEQYAERNHNIRIINQYNSGVSSARNTIIEHATGEWITFVDADDQIFFDSYINCIQEIINNKDIQYCINISDSNIYNQVVKKDRFHQYSYLIENEIINSPWNKFYKTDYLKEFNIRFNSEISLGEDLLFNMTYMSHIEHIYYTNKKLYHWREVNQQSLSHKYRKDKFEVLMRVNNCCKEIFDDEKVLKALEYIKAKNCISCVKDEIINKNENLNNYISRLRNTSSKEFLFLNNGKQNIIYFFWYFCPKSLLIKLIRSRFKIEG